MSDLAESTARGATGRGRLLIVAAAVLWSSSGLFAQAPLFADWPLAHRGTLLAFWRAAFAALVLLPFVRRPRWHRGLIPLAATFLAMNVAFLNAMVSTSTANAIWLQYTAPAWVFIIGAIFLKEAVTPRDWRLLVCGISGVGVILWFSLRGGTNQNTDEARGVLYGLLSGAFYGRVVLSLRVLREENAAWLVWFSHAVAALALLPVACLGHIWPVGGQWPYLAAFGCLQMGLPYLLFARGLKTVTSHEAAGITLLEPLLVPLWTAWVWHGTSTYHIPQRWTWLGAGLILAGLVMRYWPTHRTDRGALQKR